MNKEFFFIAAPYLHNRGIAFDIESDIFFYFKKSLEESKVTYDYARFNIDSEKKITLDFEYLKTNLKKNHIVLIDANFNIGDDTNLYPSEMVNLFKENRNKIVSIIPDLKINTNLKTWCDISSILIGFSKSGTQWANENNRTDKFKYYPSVPVPRICNETFDSFNKRPYDIGYIGSNKIFRVNFLSSILRRGGNKISTMFISSHRNSELIKSTMDYLDLIKKCKFYVCTRATFYEKYNKNIFDQNIHDGHFAGRVSEAIACGCIPLYWQPKKGNLFTSFIREKIFHSHQFKSNFFENTSHDKTSFPYDDIENNLHPAVKIAKDSNAAIKIIKSKDEKDLQHTLSTGIKLYEKYIDPKQIINFIESNLIEHG
jgi:hypothetical protein